MQYKRRLAVTNEDGLLVELDYGLYHPTNIKLLDREAPSYKPLLSPDEIEEIEEAVEAEDEPNDTPVAHKKDDPPVPEADPLAKLAVVKRVAADVGGWDRLQEMIDLLRPPTVAEAVPVATLALPTPEKAPVKVTKAPKTNKTITNMVPETA